MYHPFSVLITKPLTILATLSSNWVKENPKFIFPSLLRAHRIIEMSTVLMAAFALREKEMSLFVCSQYM